MFARVNGLPVKESDKMNTKQKLEEWSNELTDKEMEIVAESVTLFIDPIIREISDCKSE